MMLVPRRTRAFARLAAVSHGVVITIAACLPTGATGAEATGAAPPVPAQLLELEAKIPLGEVRGRIDHLAVDPRRQRLFVAELGNDSVGVVDLDGRKTLRTLTDLKEPQGIGYVTSTDTLYVANAGDGTVRLYQGEDLKPLGQIPLGSDADNVRVDEAAHRLFVGYGSGALAVIDTQSRQRLPDIPLRAHPESFQLDSAGSRIFINVPDAREIAVADRLSAKQVASWSTGDLHSNYPLSLDAEHRTVLAVFRHPATVAAFDAESGRRLTMMATCGDSDDLFVDQKRRRLYVSCGEGYIQVFALEGTSYVSMGRIPTVSGARTSFFSPDLDRLYLAVRATGSSPASIWVYRP